MDFEYNLIFFALVAIRLTGCIVFSPIYGRRNIPARVKAGLIFVLSILVCQVIPAEIIEVNSILVFAVLCIKELFLGFIIGLIMRMFFSIVTVGGELMDMQIGLSMAKAFDAQNETSSTVSSSLFNIMFLLIFFLSNAHISLMKIFMELATLVPYSDFAINISSAEQIIKLFSLILIYSVKLALPIIAVEFVTEVGVGILMKAVPQINVFIVNLQLKVLIGLVTIMLLVPTFSAFFDRMTTLMFDQIHSIMG